MYINNFITVHSNSTFYLYSTIAVDYNIYITTQDYNNIANSILSVEITQNFHLMK